MRFRLAVPVIAVAALLGPAAAGAAAGSKPVARGSGGAVVSDTLPSTRAGLDVLKKGGSAADAAVAVAATLGVTDPYVAGIGGGGYFVYYDAATHRVSTLDGRETTPAAATSKLFIDPKTHKAYEFPTAVTSGLSVGVPGNLATWQRALARWGRLGLAADLAPAQSVAANGFPVDSTLPEQTRENAKRFAQFSSTRSLFLPGGKLPQVGSTFRNPDLAATYAQIRREGPGALYGGTLGNDVVNTVHNLPLAPGATLKPITGLMQLSDLQRYSILNQAPTHVAYRGTDVYGMAPSSSGGSTVGEALKILSHFRLGKETRVQALHHYLEASRLAFADRNRYVGDPRFAKVPLKRLLSDKFGKQRACKINPHHALKSPVAPGNPFAGSSCHVKSTATASGNDREMHTNHFVVSDAKGDVVSYTNTIEELGGSGIVVPGRGFLLNNELTDFNFTSAVKGAKDPNLPAPGKRPRSSMAPTIVLKHHKPFLALGSPGGATIITTVLQVLLNRLDFGMSLEHAIAAPRASQRNAAKTQAEPAFLKLKAAAGLKRLGQKFEVVNTSPLDPKIKTPTTIGAADGLEFLGRGKVLAAGEPRRRGGSSAGVVKRAR